MAFLGQEEQLREFQDRFKYLYVALFFAVIVILGRLTYLQVLQGDQMRAYSEENRIKRVQIPAPRGMIFDRNRTLLIDNQPSFDLEVTSQYLKESGKSKEVIAKLAEILKVSIDDIQKSLEKSNYQPAFLPVKLKEDLSRDEVANIESWKIDMPGVAVEMEIKRTNIFGDIASNLLGYIGKVSPSELPAIAAQNLSYKMGDNIGKGGIEKQLENVLRGTDGEELIEVDALGRRIREMRRGRVLSQNAGKTAVPGKNLVLTIDQDLQIAATKAFGEKVGGLVAIDPRNGEILAMISRPSFDPTEFSRGISSERWAELIANEDHPLRDKTIQDHYPPGSTFKVITSIAALEEGIINEKTLLTCSGELAIGNRKYHCAKKQGHGSLSIVSAITQSCDIFFYKVAQKLRSVDDIAKWAFALGLGRRTGIELPREVPGLIPTEEWKQRRFNQAWNLGETVTVAIGQSFVLANVLQLANLYATIANGGTLYKPHYIRSVESYFGHVLQEAKPEVMSNVKISPRTLELIREGLWGVVNNPHGTAYAQHLPDVEYAGKTGTSQVMRFSAEKIFQKCGSLKYRQRHHGLFAGFAPAKDPVIAVAVLAEHACSGAGGAAPIAKAVIKTYIDKYYPNLKKEKVQVVPVTAPSPGDLEE